MIPIYHKTCMVLYKLSISKGFSGTTNYVLFVNLTSQVEGRQSNGDYLNWQSMVTLLHPLHCP